MYLDAPVAVTVFSKKEKQEAAGPLHVFLRFEEHHLIQLQGVRG
jgi:hypothetical protein